MQLNAFMHALPAVRARRELTVCSISNRAETHFAWIQAGQIQWSHSNPASHFGRVANT